MANSPITDVIFDFCGVLLDWKTARMPGRPIPSIDRGTHLRR